MKKFGFYILLSGLALASFNSCKDKKKPDNIIDDPIPASIDNYLPATAGSWWLYNSTDGNQYKRVATGTDSVKAGLTFEYFTFTNQTSLNQDPEYFNRFDGKNYFTLLTFDSSTTDATYIKLLIMKDDPYVGMEWLNEGVTSSDFGEVTMRASCKIESTTDIVETDDSTFTNAIRMKATLEGRTATIPTVPCGTITFWFVKRIGIVKQDYNIGLPLGLYTNRHIEVLKASHIVR